MPARKACLGVVDISEQVWKLLGFYTLQKENLKASGLFTARGFTILEFDT
jgi:hypothetical protein